MLALSSQQEDRARQLHSKCILYDSFGDPPSVFSERMLARLDRVVSEDKPPLEAIRALGELDGRRTPPELVDDDGLRRKFTKALKEAGTTGVSTNVGISENGVPCTYRDAVKDIARWTYLFDAMGTIFLKATKADDVKRAKKEGKFAVLFSFHNSVQFGTELENLSFFHQLGVRQIELTYNTRNFVGDGCTEKSDAGLSDFGHEVIEVMNKLGIIIDLSHSSHHTAMETIKDSSDPVIFSHSNCSAIYEHDRNVTDEELSALSEKGGYIGISILPSYLTKTGKATFDDYLDHIDHVVDLVGVDHVGIGADDNGASDTPQSYWNESNRKILPLTGFRPEHHIVFGTSTEGFLRYTDWPNFTRGLVSRGYSDQEIEKILGGNFLRVLEKVAG